MVKPPSGCFQVDAEIGLSSLIKRALINRGWVSALPSERTIAIKQ